MNTHQLIYRNVFSSIRSNQRFPRLPRLKDCHAAAIITQAIVITTVAAGNFYPHTQSYGGGLSHALLNWEDLNLKVTCIVEIKLKKHCRYLTFIQTAIQRYLCTVAIATQSNIGYSHQDWQVAIAQWFTAYKSCLQGLEGGRFESIGHFVPRGNALAKGLFQKFLVAWSDKIVSSIVKIAYVDWLMVVLGYFHHWENEWAIYHHLELSDHLRHFQDHLQRIKITLLIVSSELWNDRQGSYLGQTHSLQTFNKAGQTKEYNRSWRFIALLKVGWEWVGLFSKREHGVMNKSLKNISLIGKYSQPMEYIPKEDFPNLIISQTIPRSIQR